MELIIKKIIFILLIGLGLIGLIFFKKTKKKIVDMLFRDNPYNLPKQPELQINIILILIFLFCILFGALPFLPGAIIM
jgi:Ca2+/Na+ antiporter